MKNVPLRNQPNEKWNYSNLAYFLLSILVEEVSGETLRQYADKRIFKPLGMTNTFFSDQPTEIVSNRASGYKISKNGGYVTDMTNLFWVGDGGLHTNVDDMLKWDRNFYQPKVGKDPQALMKRFITPNSDFVAQGWKYANGQMVGKKESRNMVAHGGGWLGVVTYYQRFPDDKFSSVILCNSTEQKPWEYATKISELYFNKK